ncbi:MAG TPA: hypothetical protein VK466_07580 [Terriglobales bacterium]|nr:hypothetical protein [Terriglobales bacterium]
MSDKYDPNYAGSNTLPAPNCDAPVARETAQDVEQARRACRIHEAVNKLAERSEK